MDVEIDFGKSLEENASSYFEKSKLAKKKLSGLRRAMVELEKRASSIREKPAEKGLVEKRKRQWFESFHWFRTSQGLLVIGGRDARSNEAVVKKHMEKGDFFLHADIQGGSACIVKAEGKPIPGGSLEEAAQFSAVKSKAWQQRLPSVDVYAVSKEQVSKSAPSGEALSTGGFMIYGKRQWFRKTPLRFSIGLLAEQDSLVPMGGPPSAVEKHCKIGFEVGFGRLGKSDAAKALLAKFEAKAGKGIVSLDDMLALLPGDGLEIKD
jgi:predicted ribosome quality control (RQC) complex YloA/Tae2 family protein